MSETLRKPLMALVLLNVVFVHLTGAVSVSWLLPLYFLTVAAPCFARYQKRAVYRVGWNTGILLVFGSLALNAQTTGIVHLLEDGLLLAALCQVHLLNNLGTRQRPDLLFFNSFLIAFVTSFFSQDLGFSVAFIVYAAILIPSLQLFCATRHRTDQALGSSEYWAIVRSSAPRTAMALALTLGVFLLWPRNFARDGWMESDSGLSHAMRLAMGLGDELNPERQGSVSPSDDILMRIRLLEGNPEQMPALWRGTTYVTHGRRGWSDRAMSGGASSLDVPWRRRQEHLVRPGSPELVAQVVIEHGSSSWIMLPREACDVAMTAPADISFVASRADGNLRYEAWFDADSGQGLTYTVGITPNPTRAPNLTPFDRANLVSVSYRHTPPALGELATELGAKIPDGAPATTVAHAFARHLRNEWSYALPGEPGAARDMADFLRGAPGHCEYFASVLTMLLRHHGVPARLVSGISATEWNETRHEWVVRHKHAHAWVEAWDEQRGWFAVDATPARATADAAASDSLWSQLTDPLAALWKSVAGFDGQGRGAVLAWFRALPTTLATTLRQHPASATGLAAALVGLVVYWRRRRRPHAAISAFRRAAQRVGLQPKAGETPREFLARARTADPKPAALSRLAAAVQEHELARYRRRGSP